MNLDSKCFYRTNGLEQLKDVIVIKCTEAFFQIPLEEVVVNNSKKAIIPNTTIITITTITTTTISTTNMDIQIITITLTTKIVLLSDLPLEFYLINGEDKHYVDKESLNHI